MCVCWLLAGMVQGEREEESGGMEGNERLEEGEPGQSVGYLPATNCGWIRDKWSFSVRTLSCGSGRRAIEWNEE